MDPSTIKEGKIYSDLYGSSPITPRKLSIYIYIMYVYDFNAILTTAMKNRNNKEMIRVFIEFTTD